jgi:putative FmdB family regulatory protein
MPLYEFLCKTCDEIIIEVRNAEDSGKESICQTCNTARKRLYSNIGVSFKGSGFYSTDK